MADPRGGTRGGLVIIGIALVLVLGFVLNQPGGPVEETVGVVDQVGAISREHGATHVASVRLVNGDVVQARIASKVHPQRGHVVRVLVYKRLITRARSYAIVDPKAAS